MSEPMSREQEPQRYLHKSGMYDAAMKGFRPEMMPSATGDWVLFADYAALQVSLERCQDHQAHDTEEIVKLRAQLDTSMRRQETLARNVNDGLLEIKALRAERERLEEQLGDAHGACCEAGIEEQYESSGDLVYYTVAARIRLLSAQVTALERDFGIQREYWNESEHKLAAMTKERDDLQVRVKELEKVFEYRRST